MHCGQVLAPTGPHPAAAPVGGSALFSEAQTARRRNLVAAAVALIFLLLAAILGLNASGLLRLGAKTPDVASLRAGASDGSNNSLRAGASMPTPSLAKEASVSKPLVMPDDVLAWLKHLQRIEQRKGELTIQQVANLKVFQEELTTLGAGIGELDPYDQTGDGGKDPQSVVKGKFADLRPDWEVLIKDFNSLPPPAECKPLADDYFHALNEIPGETADIMDVLNQVTADPAKALTTAEKLKNRSYGEIDKHFQIADGRLQAICDKYNMAKFFNIKTDVAGTDSLAKMGF